MGNPAAGVYKQIGFKREAAYGVAPVAAAAQALRRVTSVFDLNKDTYKSNEIRQTFQTADYRHGVRRGKGKITGELQCKTYADFFAMALKRDFTAPVAAITGLTITIAASGLLWTITRSAGDWLAGTTIKVGHVTRLTAGAFNAANLNKNLLVTAVSALVLTVQVVNGSALVAEAAIADATLSVIGKTTFTPQTGHTDVSFAYEHYFPDMTPVQSELYTGCKVDQIALALPPTGLATLDIDVLAQNVTVDQEQYFTAPTAITTTGALAAVNGILRAGGVAYAILTGLTMNIKAGPSGDPVVGSNVIPFAFPGMVDVSGQFTAYFADVTLRDAFLNETEIDLAAVFTADNSPASDFLTFVIPRLKVGSAGKSDVQGGIVQTFTFQALEALTGGAGVDHEKTTLMIQDAQA